MLAILRLRWKHAHIIKTPIGKKEYEREEKKMKRVLDKLEEFLKGKPFLCGA